MITSCYLLGTGARMRIKGREAGAADPLSDHEGVGSDTRRGEELAMTEPHGPLQAVKVVACSTAQAGTVPYMLMADLGAEVVKIEVPEVGDNSRGSTVLPGLPSTYFETNNRGVKSLASNLKTAEGREILRKLV